MADTTTAPDFRWAAFYYPEILAALVQLKRTTWPEHTEEDPHDPVIQLYRAFAVVAHTQATRLDHAAREVYLPTARLRSSMIALASLVDYQLATAAPAETDLVADVSGSLGSLRTLIRAHSTFSTDGSGDSPGVRFEYEADANVEAGPTGAWEVWQYEEATTTFTKISAWPHTPLGGTSDDNDAIYWGMAPGVGSPLMFNRLELGVDTALPQPWHRWEYYDPDRDGEPDLVVDNGGTITLDVDSVIGTDTDAANGGEATGLEVTVTCLRTGQVETLLADWTGSVNQITTTGLLGQTSVSTNPADYLVATDWPALPKLVDPTASFTVLDAQVVEWDLPQDTDRNWTPNAPVFAMSTTYWVRARLARNGTLTWLGDLVEPVEASKTTYSVAVEVSQGRRVTDKVGSTTGVADESFNLQREPFLELVKVEVDGTEWDRVDNFLSSAAYDRDFTLLEQPDGSWLIAFGDGTNGRIPTAASAVIATYRVGGDDSGNVGADTIVRDRTGNGKIRNLRNPRAATGWVTQEGTTDESLDDLRVQIPASLRARERAVTPEDHEFLAAEFTTVDGSQVAIRALAVEEGNGPKTVQLVCVGPGGIAPVAPDLAELGIYFNGEDQGLQRVGGVAMANTSVDPEAFTPNSVNVTVTLDILEDYSDGAQAKAEASLASILHPIATRQVKDADGLWVDSGVYLWEWGGDVDLSVLLGALYTSVSGIVGINMTTPAASVTLGATELPVAGTIAVTVNVI